MNSSNSLLSSAKFQLSNWPSLKVSLSSKKTELNGPLTKIWTPQSRKNLENSVLLILFSQKQIRYWLLYAPQIPSLCQTFLYNALRRRPQLYLFLRFLHERWVNSFRSSEDSWPRCAWRTSYSQRNWPYDHQGLYWMLQIRSLSSRWRRNRSWKSCDVVLRPEEHQKQFFVPSWPQTYYSMMVVCKIWSFNIK